MRVILSIAKTTLGEAIRRRVLLIIFLVGLFLIAVAPGLSVLTARQETQLLQNLILGVIQLTSAAIAIMLTVYLIPNEIERRTIYTILSKPVERWQFILGKYFGAVGALGLMMALMTVVLIFVFWLQQREAATPATLAALARVPVAYFVQMSLLSAVAIFFSTFSPAIVNIFLSGGVYLIGSTFNSLTQNIAENENLAAGAKLMVQVLNAVVPNFQSYSVQSASVAAVEASSPLIYYINITLYAVFYVTILLIGSVLIFQKREV
ncbi:MAG: hypothetical protein MH204_01295 [Fimbriimonadaceae bacterium]|nr:hypothetical protein [Fimbriimonadaceae bacterium]